MSFVEVEKIRRSGTNIRGEGEGKANITKYLFL